MKKIIRTGLFLLCAFTLIACDDVMDTHKEFIQGGEIIYAPKPDTVFFVAGKNRIEANYIISKAPHVNAIKIYWNRNQDSLITQVELSAATTAGTFMLNNLEEKSYTFTIQLQDKYGHTSLTSTAVGTVYGETFQNSLSGRRITGMQSNNEGGIVEMEIAREGLVYNEIRYKDINGITQQLRVKPEDRSILCPNAASGTAIDYRSAYIPEEACVDTFLTDWQNSADAGMNFPHIYEYAETDRSSWEVLYYDNTDPEEGSIQNMFDNKKETYWHSNYHSATRFPYTFIIDMKETHWVGKTGAMPRERIFYSKGISYYLTEDTEYAHNPNDNNWIFIGEFDLRQEDGWQWNTTANEIIEKKIRGRFLKVVFTSGYNNEHLGAIAELGIQQITEVDGVPVIP